jgi:hypothetical protein
MVCYSKPHVQVHGPCLVVRLPRAGCRPSIFFSSQRWAKDGGCLGSLCWPPARRPRAGWRPPDSRSFGCFRSLLAPRRPRAGWRPPRSRIFFPAQDRRSGPPRRLLSGTRELELHVRKAMAACAKIVPGRGLRVRSRQPLLRSRYCAREKR